MADVPLYVVSDYSSSERRITPSWSIAQLKTKLEPITGIPPSCQHIFLKTSSNDGIPIEASDEEAVYLQSFPLAPYAELQVSETNPIRPCAPESIRPGNFGVQAPSKRK